MSKFDTKVISMWLNSLRSKDGKPLSSVELLVLTTANSTPLNAAQLVDKLNDSTLMWQGAPGTLYPILHRLKKRGLLEASGSRGTNFKRSRLGDMLLNRSLSPLRKQMIESQNYYLTILHHILEGEVPMGIHEFLDTMESDAFAYLEEIKKIKEKAKNVVDSSVDVNINFE